MILDYDDEADVMYIVFEETEAPCSYAENQNGDLLRIDKKSMRVVGCTVPFFSARVKEKGHVDIPGIGGVPLDVEATGLLYA